MPDSTPGWFSPTDDPYDGHTNINGTDWVAPVNSAGANHWHDANPATWTDLTADRTGTPTKYSLPVSDLPVITLPNPVPTDLTIRLRWKQVNAHSTNVGCYAGLYDRTTGALLYQHASQGGGAQDNTEYTYTQPTEVLVDYLGAEDAESLRLELAAGNVTIGFEPRNLTPGTIGYARVSEADLELSWTPVVGQPPPNDPIAGAYSVVFTDGAWSSGDATNIQATEQTGDAGKASVWWRIIPVSDGAFTLSIDPPVQQNPALQRAEVRLWELPDGSPVTVANLVDPEGGPLTRTFTGTVRTATLPPRVLRGGHTYYLQVTNLAGSVATDQGWLALSATYDTESPLLEPSARVDDFGVWESGTHVPEPGTYPDPALHPHSTLYPSAPIAG